MQQNSECRLCGDEDEMINHIISECGKLAQKDDNTQHDWSTENSTKNLNLTILISSICTT